MLHGNVVLSRDWLINTISHKLLDIRNAVQDDVKIDVRAAIEEVESEFFRGVETANIARTSVWIVAAENAEALPDAWVFSSQHDAIHWMVEQVGSWVEEHNPADHIGVLVTFAEYAGDDSVLWETCIAAQDYYDWPVSFALWERVIDGGGNLPL